MKKGKKLLAMGLALTMAAGMLTGCGSNASEQTASQTEKNNAGEEQADGADAQSKGVSDSDGTVDTADNGEKTKVTIWTVDRHDAEFMQSKIDEYNATNTDNIIAEYELYTENYVQAVDMAFQNNTAPDIMKYHEVVFPKYYASGKFLDLNTYLTDEQKDTFKNSMYDGINVVDGKIYYIPTTGTTGRLFYNKEIFEKCGIDKAPKTLEEMAEAAKTITSKLSGEGVYGFAANMKNPTSALSRSLNFMMEKEIGVRGGFDFAKGEYDFSGYKPALELWKQLFSAECAFPGWESLDIDPLRTQFAAGKIGMYISWTHAEPGVYKSQFPMDEEKWGCVELPTTSGAVKGAQDYMPSSGVLLNAESPNIEAAWKVYEAIWLNEDILTEYYEQGLGISIVPSVLEAADTAEVYKNNPALLIGENDKVWPLSPHEKDSSAVVVEGLDLYSTFSAMFLGEIDIDTGIADLTERYNKAYQKAISDGTMKEQKIEGFDPMTPIK